MTEHKPSRLLQNLDWNLLKVFSAIVRCGGISRAAESMARQQPAVSSALKRLENHLGVVVCRRGPGGFELTDQGKVLWEVCKRIESELALLPESFDDIANELAIQIRIVMVNNLVSTRLDAVIAKFNQLHPRTELMINVASCLKIEDMLLRNEAEVGISPKVNSHEDLTYAWLYREQHVLVCGKDHPLYGEHDDRPDRFADQAFVLPSDDEAVPVRLYRERHQWGRNIVGQSLDLNEVKRLVIAGLGVALLPQEFLEPDLQRGLLWRLMAPSPETQDDIFIIAYPENPRYFAVRQFLDMLADTPELSK